MKLRELAYLADENLDPDVAAHLRSLGWDVKTLADVGLLGSSDADILRAAFGARRVVLTHDGDFGRLTFAAGEPCFGIVRLRPGHIRAEFTIATLDALLRKDPDVSRRSCLSRTAMRLRSPSNFAGSESSEGRSRGPRRAHEPHGFYDLLQRGLQGSIR